MFLNYIDPDNRGFVSFQDFHKKLRGGITQQDEMGRSTVTSYMVPSREIQLHQSSNLEYVKRKTEQLRSSFQPPSASDGKKQAIHMKLDLTFVK